MADGRQVENRFFDYISTIYYLTNAKFRVCICLSVIRIIEKLLKLYGVAAHNSGTNR